MPPPLPPAEAAVKPHTSSPLPPGEVGRRPGEGPSPAPTVPPITPILTIPTSFGAPAQKPRPQTLAAALRADSDPLADLSRHLPITIGTRNR
jgi:hypothetical protein